MYFNSIALLWALSGIWETESEKHLATELHHVT